MKTFKKIAWVAAVVLTALGFYYTANAANFAHVPEGGTGWQKLSANTILLGNDFGNLGTTSVATNGQFLIFNNGVWGPVNSPTTTANSWSQLQTFLGGILVNNATSTITNLVIVNGTSTNATTTSFAITNALSCSGTQALTTNSSGSVVCGTITGTGGAAFPFTPTSNFGALTNATATPIWFQAGLQASSSVDFGSAGNTNFHWDNVNGRLGIGTMSPAERLHISAPTGNFTTIRFDSGTTQGYFFAYDGDTSVNIGANSNASLNFRQNNTTVGTFDTTGQLSLLPRTGQKNIITSDAPTADPQESTLTTRLNSGSGNTQFVDWTLENYGTDNQASINIAKSGTKGLVPFSVRFWNSDLGNIAANGVYAQTWLPNGTIGFGVSTSTAGATAGGANTFLYGASSTVSTLFKLDAAPGTTRFQITSAGIASTTNLTISQIQGCSGSNALTTNSTGVVACGAISGGGGAAFPFTPLTNYAVNTSATSTPIWAQLGLFASSTSRFDQIQIGSSTSGTMATSTNFGNWVTTGNASSTGLTVSGIRSALVLTGAQGSATAYGGASPCTNQVVTAFSAVGATTCATVTNAMLTSSTISGVALGGTLGALTATDSTLTFSGSYTGAAARTVGLNLGNPNTWSVLQTFGNATSTSFSSTYASSTRLFAGAFTLSTTTAGCLNNSSTGVVYSATCLGGTPGGSDKQIQFNDGGSAFAGASGLVWDKVNSLLGVGSTTPWGILSVASSTYNYTTPLFAISTSSDKFGRIFQVTSTSTAISGGDSGARVAIGPFENDRGMLMDQLNVNGRINTGDWAEADCYPGIGSPDAITVTTVGACKDWTFRVGTAATYNLMVGTLSARIKSSGAANSWAGLVPINLQNPISAAGTPVIEAAVTGAGLGTSTAYIGLAQGNWDPVGGPPPGNFGCWITASSTTANWKALCSGGLTTPTWTVQIDTGVPTTTSTFTVFRMEMDSKSVRFYYQPSGGTITYIGAVLAGGTTYFVNPSTPFIAIGTGSTASTPSNQLEVLWARVWYKMPH